MDYLAHIEDIAHRLGQNNRVEANMIKSFKYSSSTPSELLMSVTQYLVSKIEMNKELKTLIGEEVLQLKNFCSSVGLTIRVNLDRGHEWN
ncbi:hypothetical protein ACFQ1M_06270 [Sungkyunkwania multivorans]|uniref:Uncharacterized protein n=1 Tax=Sungkyunkwania multivorans TaxID=1173618 RepID=A0ABW3CWA4_9FLAO